jgi:hypothetical protein
MTLNGSFARPGTTQCSVCSTATLAEAKKQGTVLAWGNFLTVEINFVIVAWVLFFIVKVPCGSTRRQSLRGRHARKRRLSRSSICSPASEPPACLSKKPSVNTRHVPLGGPFSRWGCYRGS